MIDKALFDEQDVVGCFGLMSDTHMPERWHTLPPTLSTIFANVDMILHAGDVGELWVLDQLSQIAPVIAVHGNDEPRGTPQQLAYKQLIAIAGQRLLLWHGHYPDRVDEMESRRLPNMRPKLERIARHGQRVGAKVVHFGHWHIPLVCEVEGVLLINAGAIASGNFATRQLVQTVALLWVLKNGRFHVTHIDVSTQKPHATITNIVDNDFATAAQPYIGSILAPDLRALVTVQNQLLYKTLRQLAPRCWWGGQPLLTRTDFITILTDMTPQTPETREALHILHSS